MPIGLTLPFARTTGSVGYLEFTSDEFAAIHQNLRSLLVTNWGERVMHYKLGCNLIEFLFEPRVTELRDKIADRVISQLATYMSFVVVDELVILFSEDDGAVPENGIGVHIKFRLTSRPDFSSIFNHIIRP